MQQSHTRGGLRGIYKIALAKARESIEQKEYACPRLFLYAVSEIFLLELYLQTQSPSTLLMFMINRNRGKGRELHVLNKSDGLCGSTTKAKNFYSETHEILRDMWDFAAFICESHFAW